MNELKGRVAVVTGGASGIGLAMCSRFAAEGMRIVMVDVQGAALEAAADKLRASKAEVLTASVDVSDWDAMQGLASQVTAKFGGTHILCNNAGIRSMGPIWETSIEDWRWVLGVNFMGVLHGIKAFLPAMIKSGKPGHIVNTASVAGLLGFKNGAPYSASKSAVVSMSEVLYQELREIGAPIGTSVLCPGGVPTNFRENSSRMRPSGQRVEPRKADAPLLKVTSDDVAEKVLLAIRDSKFWIFTHPPYEQLFERRHHGMLHTDEVVGGESL